jgi:dTDP-4-dehydrorhamnose 3,5-epimerase
VRADQLTIQGAWLLTSDVFRDARGAFEVAWESARLHDLPIKFTPSNAHHSYNLADNTLRGFHFQKHPHGQAKLVSCVAGKALDVMVDLRRDSTTFGKWQAIELEAASGKSVYIPAGCGHGFLTLKPHTTIAYLIEGDFLPQFGRALRWNDEKLGIPWPAGDLIMSDKDAAAPGWDTCDF